MILRVWDVTFTVSDLERAVDFYEHVLGLPKKYQYSSDVHGSGNTSAGHLETGSGVVRPLVQKLSPVSIGRDNR